MPFGMRVPSDVFGGVFIDAGFDEVIVPSIWETETFLKKLGAEKEAQMWTFRDRGDRNCCLIPEVTGIFQELWRTEWSKKMKSASIFYVSRCYRYERPQAGRYREFTQVGVELLGGQPGDQDRAISTLRSCLDLFRGEFVFRDTVQRGLSYYVADGFEVECPALGTQRQVAGGGRYAEGVGWAIGLERILLAESFAGV